MVFPDHLYVERLVKRLEASGNRTCLRHSGRDGRYRSGDLGRINVGGYLHLFGRAVDIDVIDGHMISPTLIEETLCRLPDIRYAAVVVDRDRGRRVAVIIPWPGRRSISSMPKDALPSFLRPHLDARTCYHSIGPRIRSLSSPTMARSALLS
jgi:acyl-coenzyme A synthetase/AMP-(fatty) acid ligase